MSPCLRGDLYFVAQKTAGILKMPAGAFATGFFSNNSGSRPDGFAPAFAGADAEAFFKRQHEDFAVADAAGF